MAALNEEPIEEPISEIEHEPEQKVIYYTKYNYRTLTSGEVKCYVTKQKYVCKERKTVYKGGKKPQPHKKELRDSISSMTEIEAEEIVEYMKEYKIGKFRVDESD